MKKRIITITGLLLCLILLAAYSAYNHPWLELNTCLSNPEKYDGQTVIKFREPLIGKIYDDGFQLIQRHGPSIRVYADTTGLIPNKFIAMKAVFRKEGYLEALSLHVSSNRRYKIVLSVIPVIFIVMLILKHFHINLKKIQIEGRKDA